MIIWIAFVALGIAVAVSDLAAFRIPNWATLSLLLLFALVVILRRADFPWLDHLGAFLLCLGGGVLFFGLRQMGAGDAKLLAAVALWSGLSAIIPLLFWIGVMGLVELFLILAVRRLMPRLQWWFPKLQVPRVLRRREGVPFGVGIAMGAIVASLNWFPSWLWVG